jgi:hypothetical protein
MVEALTGRVSDRETGSFRRRDARTSRSSSSKTTERSSRTPPVNRFGEGIVTILYSVGSDSPEREGNASQPPINDNFTWGASGSCAQVLFNCAHRGFKIECAIDVHEV